MFESLKSLISKMEKIDESSLTSLNLKMPPLTQKRTAAEPGNPTPPTRCSVLNLTPEAVQTFKDEFQRRYQEWFQTGPRPVRVFFGVLPQQGQPITGVTPDGKHTVVFLFDTPLAARPFLSKAHPAAVIAGVPVFSLPAQAEKWKSAGINAFSLNACPICGSRNAFNFQSLESQAEFEKAWGHDFVLRFFRSGLAAQQFHRGMAKDQKQSRATLEYLRDHWDASNPYVHWLIAILAGMAGDMEANAASIKRLEEFGPPFVGKLRGTNFDISAGSQFATFPEASVGLLASYKLLIIPQPPPAISS